MGLSDLNNLKKLSWYTTVPLIVCAWLLQDLSLVLPGINSAWGFLYLVSNYFVKVCVVLGAAYAVWLYVSAYIEQMGFPFTLIAATFLMTISIVGFGFYFIKPEGFSFPVNIVWFGACASVAFNLYQIEGF